MAVISYLPAAGKVVALTFDACSQRSPSHFDRKVTDVLLRMKVPATIFVGGLWSREESKHLKFLASRPQFEIGNHTWNHPHLPRLTEKQIRRELEATQEEVQKQIGITPRYFRPPFGELDEKTVRMAAQLGLTTVEYDFPSGDPDLHATKERLVEWVVGRSRPGSIVVMHINERGWHTAEALPQIVEQLRARGFELVTVGEMVRRARESSAVKDIASGSARIWLMALFLFFAGAALFLFARKTRVRKNRKKRKTAR